MLHPSGPAVDGVRQGAAPRLLLRLGIFGIVLIAVLPVLALLSQLRSTEGERKLIAAINDIPIRPEASVIRTKGPYRLVSFPDRPARLVGVESLRSGQRETRTWFDDQLDLLSPGLPFAVRLSYTTATDDDLENVASLPSLEFVALNSTRITDAGLSHLRRLPRVTFLSVGDTAVTDTGAETISEMPSLSMLDVQASRITSLGLAKLAQMESLQALNIADTIISGDGLALLASLRQLTGLNASGLRIGDDDVGHLCRIKNLRHLDLSRTEITDRGLIQLASLDSLRELRITDVPITPEGLARFRRASPDVMILTDTDHFSHPIDW